MACRVSRTIHRQRHSILCEFSIVPRAFSDNRRETCVTSSLGFRLDRFRDLFARSFTADAAAPVSTHKTHLYLYSPLALIFDPAGSGQRAASGNRLFLATAITSTERRYTFHITTVLFPFQRPKASSSRDNKWRPSRAFEVTPSLGIDAFSPDGRNRSFLRRLRLGEKSAAKVVQQPGAL